MEMVNVFRGDYVLCQRLVNLLFRQNKAILRGRPRVRGWVGERVGERVDGWEGWSGY